MLLATSCSVLLLVLMAAVNRAAGLGQVMYAVNCGGEGLVDSHGVRYSRDPLVDVGIPSDYGRMLDIKRVPAQDKPLYQHERYATDTFGYTIPLPAADADYVLWLKFSEVWFNAPHQKVFDVSLNGAIVVNELDIFEKVGRGVAHDELVGFQVRSGKILINGKAQPFNSQIRVEFIKGQHDNPKINAIAVIKGTVDQIPKLPAYEPEKPAVDEDEEEDTRRDRFEEESEEDENEMERAESRLRRQQQSLFDETAGDDEQTSSKRNKKTYIQEETADKIENPYASDESSYLIPILVAIGAFIPLLFCLCKI